MLIKPEDLNKLHERGGLQHRLKDPKKWQPLGIDSGQTEEEPVSPGERNIIIRINVLTSYKNRYNYY